MRTQLSRCLGGAALVGVAWLLTTQGNAGDKASPWKAILPEDAYKELVNRAVKTIEVNADSKDDDLRKQAQVAAVRIAAYTLTTKGDPKQLAAQRALARKVANFIKVGHLDRSILKEAKKLAESLPRVKEGDGSPEAGHELNKHFDDVMDLMNLYRTKMKGGEGLPPELQTTFRLKGTQNGVEEKIRYLAMKQISSTMLDKEAADLELFGYKMAADGALTGTFAAEQKKDARDWSDLSAAMRDAGVALAEAAKKKNPEAVFKASTALNNSCSQCHSMFRKGGG